LIASVGGDIADEKDLDRGGDLGSGGG